MLTQTLTWFKQLFVRRTGTAELVIVRRYDTPTGSVGELYLDGKMCGVCCDNVIGAPHKQSFRRSGIRFVSQSFDVPVSLEHVAVGSIEPGHNVETLKALKKELNQFKDVNLTIINRLWAELH